MKILIIGGVAGGASFAARMRRLNENAEITILERSGYIAFANCGLPYHISGTIQNRDALTIYTAEAFSKRFKTDVRVNSEALSIDRKNKKVTVKNVLNGDTYELPYDKLILSMGAEPIKPPLQGIDSEGIFTLRNIPDMDNVIAYIKNKKPSKAVVVGGGYIGIEVAENLAHMHIDTTIVEMADHLVAPLDADMANILHKYIKDKGIKLELGNKVNAFEKTPTGLKLTLDNKNLETELVLMSVGVRPESSLAKNAGLEINPRGCIVVNEKMLTSDPDIFAIGDAAEVTEIVTGTKAFLPLAGPANKQGRIVADIIGGIKREYKGSQGSAILKVFDMTVATTGVNEKTAKANKMNYEKVIINAGSHAGYYPDSTRMWMKTLFDKETGKILGTQIIGFDGVDKRCDIMAVAIRAGMTAEDLTELELCYAPPFSSAKDPVNMMGYAISNVLEGTVKIIHWHDVDALPRDGSVNLVDVRDTQAEGAINGFIHIPLMTLRDNLDKIDKSKPVYVHCHTGLTSYIANRILIGSGYNSYNICGGYKFYSIAKGK